MIMKWNGFDLGSKIIGFYLKIANKSPCISALIFFVPAKKHLKPILHCFLVLSLSKLQKISNLIDSLPRMLDRDSLLKSSLSPGKFDISTVSLPWKLYTTIYKV